MQKQKRPQEDIEQPKQKSISDFFGKKTTTKKADDDQLKQVPDSFYEKDVVTLAQDLLGKLIVHKTKDGIIACRIVETEAYKAPEDKACHAYKNKKTEKTSSFWLPGGHVYMFTIYNNTWCFNVVAATAEEPEAVLVRAVEPIKGLHLIHRNRSSLKSNKTEDLVNGPGKLTLAMGITKERNGFDMRGEGKDLFIAESPENLKKFEIVASKRINIDYAEEWIDKYWRFTIKDNKFVSVPLQF
ncbi:hypothetical protein ABPG74_011069 [Tetrahymena malaccensis]